VNEKSPADAPVPPDAERSLGDRMFGERVLDAVPEVVLVFDRANRAVWWNDHTVEATGYDDLELATLDPMTLFAPEDREEVEREVGRLLEADAEPPMIETALVTSAGDHVPYEFVGSSLTGPEGEIAGVAVTGRDISDRRARQELERQNERLDEFASLVSHDLRNPLTVAEGYLSLVREFDDSDDLARVAEAHDRMYDLIEDLLTLARGGNTVGETVSVSLAETARSAWHSVGTGEATLDVVGDVTLDGDPDRLQNLFENLYRNAMEHASVGSDGEDRTPRITVGPLERGFFVEDDGPGIPDAERESVFESGYTTTRSGTGFGLAIVEGICEAHGWSVSLRDADGGGARFEVDTGSD
jgi:PAS domain S-box-containing protein